MPTSACRVSFRWQMRLGLVSGKATLALADRLGQWTAQHTQETVHRLLQEEHDVSWSATTIRKISADLSVALAPLTPQIQVEQLLHLLQQAHDSKGPHRPVLSVGRDGIFVPLRKDTHYREAAKATVAVLDRNGRRLGTVYLGHMPEPGQKTLPTTDRSVDRCLERLARSVATFAIRDGRRASPE